MKEKLQELKDEFLKQLKEVTDQQKLRDFELKFLSRKGELAKLMAEIKDLNDEARKETGLFANELKKELQTQFQAVKDSLEIKKEEKDEDISLPGKKIKTGHLHPLTMVQNEIEDLFTSMGFMVLDGPELESDYYNFEALNIPPHHPARDMQDTFYVDLKNKEDKYDLLMRTQTSNVQVRMMKKYGAPLKAIIPGRVFRCEATEKIKMPCCWFLPVAEHFYFTIFQFYLCFKTLYKFIFD